MPSNSEFPFSRRRNATNIEIVKPLHFLRHTDIKYVRQFFTLQIVSLQYRAVCATINRPAHYPSLCSSVLIIFAVSKNSWRSLRIPEITSVNCHILPSSQNHGVFIEIAEIRITGVESVAKCQSQTVFNLASKFLPLFTVNTDQVG